MRTIPVEGVSSPASSASSVDFPEPDTPTTATLSPVRTCLARSATFMIGLSGLLNIAFRLVAACALMLWAAGACAATILVFGDSLSAGYGLPGDRGWVNLLAGRLDKE